MIRVVIDSGTDRNEWLNKNYDYDFIPLTVILDGEPYLDKEEIKLQDVYDYMTEGNFPKTTQITPYQAEKVFKEAAEQGDDVIFLSLFKEFSGTYQVGYNALNTVKEEYPNFKGEIIDTLGASGGASLLLIQTCELIKAGYSFEEVVEEISAQADHMMYKFSVDDMNWLAKGGRLPKSVGKIGSVLKVKPILGLDDNGIKREGMARGKKQLHNRLISDLVKNVGDFTDQLIAIGHVGKEDDAKLLESQIREKLPEAKFQIFSCGPILATHLGLGSISLFYHAKRPDKYIMPETLD